MSFTEWVKSLFGGKVAEVPAPVTAAPVVEPPPFKEESKTPWMDFAKSKIGEKELPGTQENNPWIVSLFKWTSYFTKQDETPWCAAFVNWCLGECGYKRTNSAAAKSFDNYGNKCELQFGAVVTIKHHTTGGRHVTLCWSPEGSAPYFKGLGGNQSNSVRVSNYMKDEIVSIRWPVK